MKNEKEIIKNINEESSTLELTNNLDILGLKKSELLSFNEIINKNKKEYDIKNMYVDYIFSKTLSVKHYLLEMTINNKEKNVNEMPYAFELEFLFHSFIDNILKKLNDEKDSFSLEICGNHFTISIVSNKGTNNEKIKLFHF